jgi:membrane fusion protein (multidrug efflux system)
MTHLAKLRHRLRALSVMAALLSSACGGKKEEKAEAKPVVAANTVTAGVESFTRTISAIGTVVARPDRYAALSAPSATRIAKVHVAVGQRIAAGAPLVEFEQGPFVAAAAGTEAALSAAQKAYDRALRLANEGIVPRKDAEQAAADLAKARADAVAAERALQLSVLRSPVSGTITKLTAVLGQPADAGQVLVEIVDPSGLDAVLSLGPTDASQVLPGASVRLIAGEKPDGEDLGAGRVASVAANVDSATRAVSIRVVLPSPKRSLRLGESVYGEIATSTRRSVVIPVEALLPGEEVGTYKVFVVDAKGTATEREVKIGGRNAEKVEIEEGLKGGEKIVSQGAFSVEDSAKVSKPVPVKP